MSGKLRHSDICVPRSRGYDDVDTGWTHDSLTVVLLKRAKIRFLFPYLSVFQEGTHSLKKMGPGVFHNGWSPRFPM